MMEMWLKSPNWNAEQGNLHWTSASSNQISRDGLVTTQAEPISTPVREDLPGEPEIGFEGVEMRLQNTVRPWKLKKCPS
jgi:hypothetical protein